MAQPEHSKIIHQVASKILKPHGLVRKGQSRTWYDDHGWYTTIVEFQPHKWEHGAFLNVGVNFHWYEQDYESFDMGYRETGFEKFESAEQFVGRIEPMVQLALDKVLAYREQLSDPEQAKQTILNYTFTSEEQWGYFHKGVICGITGDLDGLNHYFEHLLADDYEVEWFEELKSCVRKLKEMTHDAVRFKKEINNTILTSRKLKKLKEVELTTGW